MANLGLAKSGGQIGPYDHVVAKHIGDGVRRTGRTVEGVYLYLNGATAGDEGGRCGRFSVWGAGRG